MGTNTALNAKINEIKNKIPSITNLASTSTLTTVENKIPEDSDLIKKADYDKKISEIENKYFAISDYNKLTSNTLDAKVTQKIYLMNLNEKIKISATKEEIKTLAT